MGGLQNIHKSANQVNNIFKNIQILISSPKSNYKTYDIKIKPFKRTHLQNQLHKYDLVCKGQTTRKMITIFKEHKANIKYGHFKKLAMLNMLQEQFLHFNLLK